jgi:hypothetical protein
MAMGKGNRRSKVVGKGIRCQCGTRMKRINHGLAWHPKEGQPYYFAWWDWCPKCRRTQHYEQAKVYLETAE